MGFNIGSVVGGAAGGMAGGIPGMIGGGIVGQFAGTKLGLKGPSQPAGVGAPKYPKFKMRKAGSFEKKMTPEQIARVDVSKAMNPLNEAAARRFGLQRERTSQDLNKARTDQFGALQRRFAATGGGASGARLKLEAQAAEANDRMRSDAMREIDTAEEMGAAERDSQAALTQAGYDQQRNLAQADMNFKSKVFSFERGSKLHELDLAERQQKIDQVTTQFNSQVAAQMARPPKQGIFSSLLDGIL